MLLHLYYIQPNTVLLLRLYSITFNQTVDLLLYLYSNTPLIQYTSNPNTPLIQYTSNPIQRTKRTLSVRFDYVALSVRNEYDALSVRIDHAALSAT